MKKGILAVLLASTMLGCTTSRQESAENQYFALFKPFIGKEFYLIQHKRNIGEQASAEFVSDIYAEDIANIDKWEKFVLGDCIVPSSWKSPFSFMNRNTEKLRLVFNGSVTGKQAVVEIDKQEIDGAIGAASGKDFNWKLDHATDWFLITSGPNPWNGRTYDYYGGQAYSKNAVFSLEYVQAGVDYLASIKAQKKKEDSANAQDPYNRFRGGYWLGGSEVVYVIDMDIWHVYPTDNPAEPFSVIKIGNLQNLVGSDVKFVTDKTNSGKVYIRILDSVPYERKWNKEEALKNFSEILKANHSSKEALDKQFNELTP